MTPPAPRTGPKNSRSGSHDAERDAAITMPGKLPRPPSTQMAKMRPIYSRPIDGSTGWMIMAAPASAAVAKERPEGDALDAGRIGRHEAKGLLVLGDGLDRTAYEGARQKKLQTSHHQHADQERHQKTAMAAPPRRG